MRKSVTLECSAINVNKSITRLDYQWQKEFVDISGASKNTYETLEPGSYRCKITNGYRTVYTQDAIVTLEPIWVTDIIINTQSITNNGKIQYTVNPEEADDKTITFDTKITPEYTIDAAGNVTINTDGCNFEVVARSQFGKDYSEVIGRKTITGYTRVAVKSITITTTTIQDAGQIQTSVSPENASIVKKEFELLSGSEYVEMDSTGYVSKVISPGTFSVRVSGFDKAGNVVTNTKSISATNEFVKITGVSITTDTISNGNPITYKTIPPSVPANLKSVKIELYNQGNPEYVDVNIDSKYIVTGITEDMDGKKFKAKITVVDNYDNTVSNTKEITCKHIIPVTKMWFEPTTFTDTGVLTTFYEPANATPIEGYIPSITPSSYVSSIADNQYRPPSTYHGKNGVFTTSQINVLKSGDVKCNSYLFTYTTKGVPRTISCESTLTLKKTPVEPTGDYFIAKTARGDKSGRGSWDNATDDIKIFDYNGDGKIRLGNTYIETGKKCDFVNSPIFLTLSSLTGGCKFGSFISNSSDRSSITNITNITPCVVYLYNESRFVTITNCDFYNIVNNNNTDNYNYGVNSPGGLITTIITNCDFYNISVIIPNTTVLGAYGISISSKLTATNCNFHDIYMENIDGYNHTMYGIRINNPLADIRFSNCKFYNIISNVANSNINKEYASMYGFSSHASNITFDACNFYDINSYNRYGIYMTSISATIENCTFSAIESNDSTKYTPYSSLIKILPPETGCKFLPKDKAQSIYFSDDCILNGKKVSSLLNS